MKQPAAFNNELCRICREYAAKDAEVREILTRQDAPARQKKEMKDGEMRLAALLLAHQTAEKELVSRQELAVEYRHEMIKNLEEALSRLTGSPVHVRMSGPYRPGLTRVVNHACRKTWCPARYISLNF